MPSYMINSRNFPSNLSDGSPICYGFCHRNVVDTAVHSKHAYDPEGPPKSLRNLSLMLYFRFFCGIAYAVRTAVIFDNYIFLKYGNHTRVGIFSFFSGIASLIAAPSAGIISDVLYYRRSVLLQFLGFFGLFCSALNYAALFADSFYLLISGTFCSSLWYHSVFVITESLFTDSMPKSSRTDYFVYRRVVTTLSHGLGPFISLILFKWSGDVWDMEILSWVLRIGVILSLPQNIILFLWEDLNRPPTVPTASTASLPEGEERKNASKGSSLTSSVSLSSCPTSSVFHSPNAVSPTLCDDTGSSRSSSCDTAYNPVDSSINVDDHQEYFDAVVCRQDDVSSDEGAVVAAHHLLSKRKSGTNSFWDSRTGFFSIGAVPWLIYTAHNITFMGAGMTVKYFPLFFREEFHFTPIGLCLLSSSYTLLIVVFTFGVRTVSSFVGRPLASFLFTFCGLCCLYILANTYFLPLVICVYLLRGAFQNASSPIDRAILMDYVSEQHKGKWTALFSLTSAIWSMSALFGGFLADVSSFRYILRLTGYFYIAANLVYFPCIWLVDADKKHPIIGTKRA